MQQNKRTSKITNFFNLTQNKIKIETNDVVDDGQHLSQSDSQSYFNGHRKGSGVDGVWMFKSPHCLSKYNKCIIYITVYLF
jgi:hypothetical protein